MASICSTRPQRQIISDDSQRAIELGLFVLYDSLPLPPPHTHIHPLTGSDAVTLCGSSVCDVEVKSDTISELLRLYLGEREAGGVDHVRGGRGEWEEGEVGCVCQGKG